MRHPAMSRMLHKIAAKRYVVRCMVLVGCCVLVFALFMEASLAAAETQLGEAALIATEEELGQRNESTRVFLRHYEQPILDEEGKPTGEVHEFTRKVAEKADCLNYDIQDYSRNPKGPPIWEPAVCDFQTTTARDVAYEVKTGKARVYFSRSLTDKWPITYRISERGTSYELGLGIYALAYYDASTGEVRPIEAVQNVKPVANGNHLLYGGAFTVGDLEYIYDRSTFEQNLIIRNLGALVDPSTLGMNPESTYVGIISTLDLPRLNLTPAVLDQNDAEQPLATGITGDQLAIGFKDGDGNCLLTFDRSEARDASGDQSLTEARRPIRKQVTLLADDSARLFEGVPYKWLISAERQLPVTLDYLVRTGTANGNEAWQSGVTYFISDNYTVPPGKTLAIEGGAIVKVNGGKRITIASGGNVKAIGSKFDYCFFTNSGDQNIGEDLTGNPNYISGWPQYFFIFQQEFTAASITHTINYCKFTDVTIAIYYAGSNDSSSRLTVTNSIFKSLGRAITLGAIVNGYEMVDARNCLMANGSPQGRDPGDSTSRGIQVSIAGGTIHLNAINCTLNGFGDSAIRFQMEDFFDPYVTFTIKNSLFTNSSYALRDTTPFLENPPTAASHNAFWNNTTNFTGAFTSETGDNTNRYPSPSYPGGNLYNPTDIQNGEYYIGDIKTDDQTHEVPEQKVNTDIKDRGDNTAEHHGLNGKTVCAPMVLTYDNINNNNPGPNAGDGYLFRHAPVSIYNDTGTVDIGFHYDVVNAIVYDYCTLTTSLIIPAGAVMSYGTGESSLQVTSSSGHLKAQGTAANPILFTSTHITGDGVFMPSSYHYDNAIHFAQTQAGVNPSPESRIEFCEFNRAQRAIFIESASPTPFQLDYPIANCVFKKNYYGIYVYNTRNRVDILNSLFVGNNNAGVYTRYAPEANNQKSFLNLEGNTFSRNSNALRLDNNQQSTAELRAVVEDNIFSGNDIAVATAPGFDSARVYDVTRNNIFWNNGTDNQQSALDISDSTNKMNTNPLLVHHTRAENVETIADYSLPGPDDGYYLSQRTRDASRRPFILTSLSQSSGISDVTGFSGQVWYLIFVGVSEGVPTDPNPAIGSTYMGYYEGYPGGWGYSGSGSQQGPAPTWILIQVLEGEEPLTLSNAHLRLNTTQGATLEVYLPNCAIYAGEGLSLFVAEDGSTYWGHGSHEPRLFNYFSQDSYYSLRWDTNNPAEGRQPARSTYDGAGASHAVDAGSRDFLNSGYTSTDVGSLTDLTDTRRDNPYNPEQFSDLSLYERMDIGYHYFGSLRHPRERIPAISLYIPLEQGEQPAWYTPAFKVETGHQVAIASGPYNSGNEFPDTTIATFRANYVRSGPDRWYPFFLFHQFRSQNNNGMIDDPYQPFGTFRFPVIDRIAMTASTENDNPAGVTYAACTVNWYDALAAANENRGQTQLNVYRYNNNGTWTLVGQYTLLDPGAAPACLEVALAVRHEPDRQDLWVFWIEGNIGEQGTIYGARIEDAATRNTDGLGAGVPLYNLGVQYAQEQALDADWDRDWYQYRDGNPRIIWSEKDGQGRWNIQESWVPLDLDTGDPLPYSLYPYMQYVAQANSYQYTYPSLSVNQRFSINQERAFATFERSDDRIRTNTMNMAGTWGLQPQEFSAPTEVEYRFWPDVAFRFFETRRICFGLGQGNHQLFTNTECVNPDGPSITGHFPRIATNGANLIDQFIVLTSQWIPSVDSTIDLFQIDP
jgi:hypothetical protein